MATTEEAREIQRTLVARLARFRAKVSEVTRHLAGVKAELTVVPESFAVTESGKTYVERAELFLQNALERQATFIEAVTPLVDHLAQMVALIDSAPFGAERFRKIVDDAMSHPETFVGEMLERVRVVRYDLRAVRLMRTRMWTHLRGDA